VNVRTACDMRKAEDVRLAQSMYISIQLDVRLNEKRDKASSVQCTVDENINLY
jgi:hypothetical protein